MPIGQQPPIALDPRDEFVRCLHSAYEHAGTSAAAIVLRQCMPALESLAISASEYTVLRNRLRNARQYSLLCERGAARFELRQMLRALAAPT